MTIHHNTYRAYRRKIDQYNEWSTQFIKPNGWTVIPANANPPVNVTNEMRSAVEVYEFVKNPPNSYFLYINEKEKTATTWTGEKLGNIAMGNPWRSNFGDLRIHVTIKAVNGKRYHGTYYKDSGDYARVKLSA